MILNKPIHLVNKKYAIVREVEDFEVGYRNSVDVDSISSRPISCDIDNEYNRYGEKASIESIYNIIEKEDTDNYFLYEWEVVVDNLYNEDDVEQERVDGRILYQSDFGMDYNLFMDYFLYSKEVDYIVDDDEFLEFMASDVDEKFYKTFNEADTDGVKICITFVIERTRVKIKD